MEFQHRLSNYKKLPCLSVCLSVCLFVNKIQNCQSLWRWSKRVLEGPGESGRVLKGLRRVLGESLEGVRMQACLKKVGHPSTRLVTVSVD